MRQIAWKIRFLTVGAAVFLFGACDVDQTDEGEMPEVEVEQGEAPEYDVREPEVDVRADTDTVAVDTPEVDVGVPDVPDDNEQ